jgi:hypothetical protein
MMSMRISLSLPASVLAVEVVYSSPAMAAHYVLKPVPTGLGSGKRIDFRQRNLP